ncbi:MAG: hypothetical protein AAGA73_24605 [Pseudomonadota bacterium]
MSAAGKPPGFDETSTFDDDLTAWLISIRVAERSAGFSADLNAAALP